MGTGEREVGVIVEVVALVAGVVVLLLVMRDGDVGGKGVFEEGVFVAVFRFIC